MYKSFFFKDFNLDLHGYAKKCDDTDIADIDVGWFKCNSATDAVGRFYMMLDSLGLKSTVKATGEDDLMTLSNSVNPVRLKNNPVELDGVAIKSIYSNIIVFE